MNLSLEEKMLEINVCENLINKIRNLNGTFSKAFIYNFTLKEKDGFYPSINLPHSARFLFALQVKKSISKTKTYRFEINSNGTQHILLFISSLLLKNVFYAFPLISDADELSRNSPNFVSKTVFVDVSNFPSTTFDSNIHVVDVDSANRNIRVFSRVKKIRKGVYWGREFIEKIKSIKGVEVWKIKEQKVSIDKCLKVFKHKGVGKNLLDEIGYDRKKLSITVRGFFTIP